MTTGVLIAGLTAGSTGLWAQGGAAPAAGSSGRRLVAVFAHPDDETMAGPLLAHYGRAAGTEVHLVIATHGENGVMPHAKIPAGEALAAVRQKEAACAAETFRARLHMLGFPDGGLENSKTLVAVATRLEGVLREIAPQAIVTWGPEGGYGHADHRLISALVTQIVQAGMVTPNLYYAGLPKSGLNPEFLASLKFPAPFRPVEDDFLNVRVSYTPDDAALARKALGCHASQFTTMTMDVLMSLSEKVNRGVQYLRGWNGGSRRTSLFD